jgi:hypothetical protein
MQSEDQPVRYTVVTSGPIDVTEFMMSILRVRLSIGYLR